MNDTDTEFLHDRHHVEQAENTRLVVHTIYPADPEWSNLVYIVVTELADTITTTTGVSWEPGDDTESARFRSFTASTSGNLNVRHAISDAKRALRGQLRRMKRRTEATALAEARERDRKLFLNNPDRCQDCGWVEACQCGAQSLVQS